MLMNNGEFTQIFIDKGNLTTEQIEELLFQYFHKKENILSKKAYCRREINTCYRFLCSY